MKNAYTALVNLRYKETVELQFWLHHALSQMIDYSRPVPALPGQNAERDWREAKEAQLSECVSKREGGKHEPYDHPKCSDQQAQPESKAMSPELRAHDTSRYRRNESFYTQRKNLRHEEADYAEFEMEGRFSTW
ncbi:uncharacterized protein RHO25_009312 [Cercospora beticola]|uniref:Uncharacterized protein n=1 Tax=Cercospora beticola TaxID=122368 RepID=A0ABZ0NYS8_CERBT|nr:hypothetical protein RHO25_009312 [Cercospora beticola]